MSDEANEPNPYAPPKAETEGRRARAGRRAARRDLREALERLDEHLADAGNVEADRKVAGPRVRALTWGSALVCLGGVAMLVAGWDASSRSPLSVIGGLIAVVAGLIALVALIMDLSLVEHGKAATPDAALKSIFKAIPMGRFGYVWAALSPTAREQTVSAPDLAPVETQSGEFSMSSKAGVKAYTSAFARPGGNQMRQMGVKKVTLVSADEDVAEVEAELAFQSWPRWVTIVTVVGFILFRPLIIVGLILYFTTRKRCEVRVKKTLLRGRNGAWYLFDADVLEGGPSS